MGMVIRMPALDEMIRIGTLSTEEATRIKREEGLKVDSEIRRGTAGVKPDGDVDPFVRWRFNKDWKRVDLPVGTSFGSDYDYFDEVLRDCIQLFTRYAPGGDPDPLGYNWFGGTGRDYQQAWDVWYEGPHMIRFGPTVDYALFLERRPKGTAPNIPLLYTHGVLHGIADKLQRKYLGVHKIYATAMKPESGNVAAATRRHRKEPISHYPYIKITHRHAKRR